MCLVEFEDVKEIAPLAFEHQGNIDDLLIIDKIEYFVVLTSIPYNYDKSKFWMAFIFKTEIANKDLI